MWQIQEEFKNTLHWYEWIISATVLSRGFNVVVVSSASVHGGNPHSSDTRMFRGEFQRSSGSAEFSPNIIHSPRLRVKMPRSFRL